MLNITHNSCQGRVLNITHNSCQGRVLNITHNSCQGRVLNITHNSCQGRVLNITHNSCQGRVLNITHNSCQGRVLNITHIHEAINSSSTNEANNNVYIVDELQDASSNVHMNDFFYYSNISSRNISISSERLGKAFIGCCYENNEQNGIQGERPRKKREWNYGDD